jgi:hypothetical protein
LIALAHDASSYVEIPNPVKLTFSMAKRSESASADSVSAPDDRPGARGPELGRWLFVGLLLLIGLALFFVYAPASVAPTAPVAHEAS